MEDHVHVVSKEEYLQRRTALLEREKALTRENDDITKMRRDLGFMIVEKDYTLHNEEGEEVLVAVPNPQSE